MKHILIAGYGRMGSWFARRLGNGNQIAIFDPGLIGSEPEIVNGLIADPSEASGFSPDIFLNCSGLGSTVRVFEMFEPFLGGDCLLADIASVKKGLPDYYASSQRKFVSIHPMFGRYGKDNCTDSRFG